MLHRYSPTAECLYSHLDLKHYISFTVAKLLICTSAVTLAISNNCFCMCKLMGLRKISLCLLMTFAIEQNWMLLPVME